MDTQHATDHDTAAFREHQAIRCLEAAVGMQASPCRALTAAEIGTLQTAARSAANPQLRDLARRLLDLWADEREPALAALVAPAICDTPVPDTPALVAIDARMDGNVLYFDPHRGRRWDPLHADQNTGRPCDTEEPLGAA